MPDVIPRKRRWAIINLETKQYTSKRGDKLSWTYDLKEARSLAPLFGGIVIDADWLAHNWPIVAKGEPIPPEALPGPG